MTTLYINDNINFIGSSETASSIQKAMNAERERIQRERENSTAPSHDKQDLRKEVRG